MATLRDILRLLVGASGDKTTPSGVGSVDETDGFGPVRTHATVEIPVASQQGSTYAALNSYVVAMCMSLLSIIPILESTSGEPTRDKDLTTLVLNCHDDQFLAIAQAFFSNIRSGTLTLSATNLNMFLDKFGELLTRYDYSKSERLQLLTIHFLDSTISVWSETNVASGPVGRRVRELWGFFCKMLKSGKVRSWKIRDQLIRFLDTYLTQDPKQEMWTVYGDGDDDDDDDSDQENVEEDDGISGKANSSPNRASPTAILPSMGMDEDIRVRWRAAVVNARLFTISRNTNGNQLELYTNVHDHLCKTVEK